MCREDVKIGRMKTTAVRFVIIPLGSSVQIAAAANDRTHLAVCSFSVIGAIHPPGVPDGAASGFLLNSSHPREDFDIEELGQIVTGKWRATADAADLPLTIVETFFSDGVYP